MGGRNPQISLIRAEEFPRVPTLHHSAPDTHDITTSHLHLDYLREWERQDDVANEWGTTNWNAIDKWGERWHLAGMEREATPTAKKIYVLDGNRFNTLVEMAAEVTQVLALTMPWRGNLDAFNDFFRGGFGTPDDGFILVWRHSEVSSQRLGYGETLGWLEERNVAHVQERIAVAAGKKAKRCSICSFQSSGITRILN